MKVAHSNHALDSFHKKEKKLIERIDKKKKCNPKNPCWDCEKCVPARFC